MQKYAGISKSGLPVLQHYVFFLSTPERESGLKPLFVVVNYSSVVTFVSGQNGRQCLCCLLPAAS